MANSIWINPGGASTFDGTTLTFSAPVSMLSTLSVTGQISTAGGILTTASGDITISANRFLSWNARASQNSPADSQWNLTNFAGTSGIGVDVSTDSTLKVRTRAQTGYGTVDCLGLKSSGAAGASGTGTVLTQLTVVNGIVTAITIS